MKPHFTKAIVKPPGKSLVDGLSSADLGVPDYGQAVIQHSAYVQALKETGLEITVLEADENFPDSTFVEDTVLVTSEFAVITRPGAQSRRGETEAIKSVLQLSHKNIEEIKAPGTIDAGDICMVDSHFYIGQSNRTNRAGSEQMIALLEKYGMTGSVVPMSDMLHLKSGISYIENNNLVVAGEFINFPGFESYNRITVDNDEQYAANCLWINDYVLVACGFPKLQASIESLGYKTMVLEMSEFEKVDGGLSCLSLRF